jgi:hypothetical protein
VRGDVVGRRGGVAADDQVVLNVDEAQGSGHECEIEKPCDSGVTAERCHLYPHGGFRRRYAARG